MTDSRKVEHTLGPWHRKAGGYIRGLDCIVCKVGRYEDAELARQSKARWDADSRLIAAAPELLQSAVLGLEAIDNILSSHEGQAEYDQLQAAFAVLESAVARAEGRA